MMETACWLKVCHIHGVKPKVTYTYNSLNLITCIQLVFRILRDDLVGLYSIFMF